MELWISKLLWYTFPADCKETPIHQQYYSTTAKKQEHLVF